MYGGALLEAKSESMGNFEDLLSDIKINCHEKDCHSDIDRFEKKYQDEVP